MNNTQQSSSIGNSNNDGGNSNGRPQPHDGEIDYSNRRINIAHVDPHAVDVMLANELQQLSVQHREAVNEVSAVLLSLSLVCVCVCVCVCLNNSSLSSRG
jgi:hypothetical protein